MNQYTHRYSLTAADMDTRYRMTPNAVLLYYQDCWARYMGVSEEQLQGIVVALAANGLLNEAGRR